MRKIFLSLLFLSIAFPSNRALGQNLEKEFETILNKVRRSYGLDSRQEEYMLTWSGLNTKEGIRFCIRNSIHFELGDESGTAALSHLYLKNTTLPNQDVTEMIREEGNAASKADDMLALSHSFSRLSDYPLEDETILFWASFFSDNRVIETQKRKPEAYFGHPLRVSDNAASFLRGLLKRDRNWGPEDPTYYDQPNDYMEWQNRDKVKDALNAYLLREGLIEKAMQPTHEQWERPVKTPPADTAPSRKPKPRPEDLTDSGGKDESRRDSLLPYWLAAGLLLSGFGIFLYARGRK